jgi:cell cycle sensor histidine kinase DivJ
VDPARFRQIVLNLVTNAIKFTPEGGTISLGAERTADGLVVKVSDTGIGISPDNLKHVFDPFFQVEQGDTRRYAGLGLGLSIVRDVIHAMNGEVGIESAEGQGTTVSIDLPLARQIVELPPHEGIGGPLGHSHRSGQPSVRT